MNWRKPIVYALLRASRSAVPGELDFLRSIERQSPEQIGALQEEFLRRVLHHAWERSDYYHEVLSDCGAARDGKVDLSRFPEVPILTKDIIRAEGARLRARSLPAGRKAYVNRTGGSTGEPIEYWQDSYYWDVNVATKLYHFEVLGKQLGESELKLWGSDRDIVQDTSGIAMRLKNALYNRTVRTCSTLSERGIRALVADINRIKPKSIWGYIDGVYTVARFINKHGLRVHPPVAIFGGGGTLFPHMEAAIEEAFKAPAINFYGSREMGDVACDCGAKAGLHISSHSHYVEVVNKQDRPVWDESGDLVLTSLRNYAMPFLRYRIGDRGKLTRRPCPCGRGFPLLESVSGRGMESFVSTSGAIVSPIYLITSMGALVQSDAVQKIQLVQDGIRHVTVRMVLAPARRPAEIAPTLEQISARLRGVMGQDCQIDYEFVDEIPPARSGKYLYTVCLLPTAGYNQAESEPGVG